MSILIGSSLLSLGCQPKNNTSEDNTNANNQAMLQAWSCTAPENVDSIKQYLKNEYLIELDKTIRHSNFQANPDILAKIQQGIKIEIKTVTTLNENQQDTRLLECSSQLVIQLPKGLQGRAENAFMVLPKQEYNDEYDEERGSYDHYTLRDSLSDLNFNFSPDQLSSQLNYTITRTDHEGLNLAVENESDIINALVLISKYAAEYESYAKVNKEMKDQINQGKQLDSEQKALAQKVMDIRQNELDQAKASLVEELNKAWDTLTVEQRKNLQRDQSIWFEKRDADCKVLAQKSPYSLSESEKETYQKHARYWDEQMEKQNIQMQYTQCFNNMTQNRIYMLEQNDE